MTNKPQNVVRHEHFPVYTAAEIDADERLDIVRFDACELADGTCGVWCVERDVWWTYLNYDDARTVARGLAFAERDRLRAQAAAPIVPMRKGESPTEPGWYSTRGGGSSRIVEVDYQGSDRTILRVFGDIETPGLPVQVFMAHDETFIARIYPERITGGE